MIADRLPVWKKTPVLRLLIPFIAGIAFQQAFSTAASRWWELLLTGIFILMMFRFLPVYLRFRRTWITGFAVNLIFFAVGAFLFELNDCTKDRYQWFKSYTGGDGLILSPDETPKPKKNSWSATATVHYIIHDKEIKPVRGKILLYFEKDPAGKVAAPGPVRPGGGAFLLTRTVAQPVLPSGNPGGFDYRHYLLTQGITMQLYLKGADYLILPVRRKAFFSSKMEMLRDWVLSVFRRYIHDPEERGMAEALLIGYKDDLDRDLVRTYSNTGVVHIIAISGLHLGLIYGLLVLLCRPIQKVKWLRALVIITGLWSFSILAGAQPSVLRSALMFTFIVFAELASRRSTAINSLFCSAFILLCIDPWWLWDAGFLLSYAAVLSIMLYQRVIANLLYIRNKLSDFIWQLNSVTLAAQLLTIPVTIFYFHQFPVYFLLTNLLAVPVSSLIVLAEIVLLAVSGIPLLGSWMGTLISALIRIMNTWVTHLSWMPFASWTGLQISLTQSVCLLLMIVLLARWLMEQEQRSLYGALLSCSLLIALRSFSFNQAIQQQMLIVYNNNKRTVVEFVHGRDAYYHGPPLDQDSLNLYNNLLQPAHIRYRIRNWKQWPAQDAGAFLQTGKWRILIPADEHWEISSEIPATVLILSRSCQAVPERAFAGLVVADGTLAGKALQRIREDCEKRNLSFYSVREQGAFVMTLP